MPQFDDSAGGSAAASVDGDLQRGLTALAGLVNGTIALTGLLTRVAGVAAGSIPGADGAGVTMFSVHPNDHRVEALAANTPFVDAVDRIQYDLVQEGPCITAALERRSVRSGSLGGDKQWPRFGPRAARLRVHSVLSLPLVLPDQIVGTINVYAHGKHAYDEMATSVGEQFAAAAAVTVHNARALAHALALAGQLQTALSSRPIIDQAIGLMRGRSGDTSDEAFERLRTISQKENVKLNVVAQRVVDEAFRRARARRPGS